MLKQDLEKLVGQNKSIREIAKICKCSPSTIKYWLKKFDLKTTLPKHNKGNFIFLCKCGETNPKKFYGQKRRVCGKCHNQDTIRLGQEKKKKAVDCLGGSCKICGYDKFLCSLDIHHKDPTKKDPKFRSKRSWSWERLKKELTGCILLCKNCHSAVHYGGLNID
tara:strand:- start:1938 stop:2429 length:492 start_codon:yes stop_codon:yes gene_type:complete